MSGGSLGRIFTGELTEPFSSPGQPFQQISGLTNPQKPDKAKAPPPPATIADEEVDKALEEELARQRRRKGFGSTILTSPLGDTSDPTLEKKSLLGA